MSEWQPIETAPKDGRAILIYEPTGRYGNLQSDYQAERNGPRVKFDDYRFAIGYWRPYGSGGWGNRNCSDVNPTHWMPLPEPPK